MDNNSIKWVIRWLTIIDLVIISVFTGVLHFINRSKDDGLGSKPITAATSYNITNSENAEEVQQLNTDFPIDMEEVTADIVTQTVIHKEDFQGTYDEAVIGFYEDMLKGIFYISQDMQYSFDANGMFNGFYDSNNTNVAGYTYEISMVDETPTLNIYNPEFTTVVTYFMSINSKGNIVLRFGASEIYIELIRKVEMIVNKCDIKDFIIEHYNSVHPDIIMTERITDGLLKIVSEGIEKAGNNLTVDDAKKSISEFLERDNILKFVNERQPNIAPIPESVVNSIEEYFSEKLPNYEICHVYRISNHKDSDMRYAVTAQNTDGTFACWSSWNENLKSLNFGHYQLDTEDKCLGILYELYNDITGEPEKYGMLKYTYEKKDNHNPKAKSSETISGSYGNNVIEFNRHRGR